MTTVRRGGRPSVYAQRRERMDTLLWNVIRDELREGRPSADDLAALKKARDFADKLTR